MKISSNYQLPNFNLDNKLHFVFFDITFGTYKPYNMTNRRKFLAQSCLASSALMVAKPYKIVAGIAGPLISFSSPKAIILLHTSNKNDKGSAKLSTLKQQYAHTILLNAAVLNHANTFQSHYDVSAENPGVISATAPSYKIINRGDIKIGVINSVQNSPAALEEINTLSAALKNEKRCNLVICLSPLGYQNANDHDDIKLARFSTHLDVIIGGHPNNYSKFARIELNKNGEEVIINHSAGNVMSIGKIEIGFNRQRIKNNIAI